MAAISRHEFPKIQIFNYRYSSEGQYASQGKTAW